MSEQFKLAATSLASYGNAALNYGQNLAQSGLQQIKRIDYARYTPELSKRNAGIAGIGALVLGAAIAVVKYDILTKGYRFAGSKLSSLPGHLSTGWNAASTKASDIWRSKFARAEKPEPTLAERFAAAMADRELELSFRLNYLKERAQTDTFYLTVRSNAEHGWTLVESDSKRLAQLKFVVRSEDQEPKIELMQDYTQGKDFAVPELLAQIWTQVINAKAQEAE